MDSAHLTRDIREGHEDSAEDSHQARRVGIIALADEIGDGVLAELSQIRREEEGQGCCAAGGGRNAAPGGAAARCVRGRAWKNRERAESS